MLAGEVVTDLPEFAESAIFFAIEPSHLFFDLIKKNGNSVLLSEIYLSRKSSLLPSIAVQLFSSRACTLPPFLPLLCARALSVLSARHAKFIRSW